jgi:hypothetical protein
MEDIMSLKLTVHAVLVFLLAQIMAVRPISASCQNADVVPRLVAGDISGFLYTPKLSFKNLSNKQCNGIFQLLEGDFKPAAGVFEFNGVRISDGAMPLSLLPGEGLSGSLKKVDSGGYQGFGFWRQTGSCVAGLDVALAADFQVEKSNLEINIRSWTRSGSQPRPVRHSAGDLPPGKRSLEKMSTARRFPSRLVNPAPTTGLWTFSRIPGGAVPRPKGHPLGHLPFSCIRF